MIGIIIVLLISMLVSFGLGYIFSKYPIILAVSMLLLGIFILLDYIEVTYTGSSALASCWLLADFLMVAFGVVVHRMRYRF
jgi:hypothetical protein